MKIFTFWQKAGDFVPPYVLLSLTSMKRLFGENLLILTKNNINLHLKYIDLQKRWSFGTYNKNITDEIQSIVAFSDYIRIKYCLENGGFWLDADTIAIKDLTHELGDFKDDLLWHSEAVFGAEKGHPIIKAACEQMETERQLTWGNPGGIKDLIAKNEGAVKSIPFSLINPGYSPTYNYQTSNILFDKDLCPSDFLTNKKICILKLYNTEFSSELKKMSVSDFLNQNILLSKIFLHIDSDVQSWISDANSIGELLHDSGEQH